MYEVEYADDKKSVFYDNIIAENIFAQIDKKGNRHILMENIINH